MRPLAIGHHSLTVLFLLVFISGCRTTQSATLANTEPMVAEAPSPAGDELASVSPEDAYHAYNCPTGSEPISLGLKAANVTLTSAEIGMNSGNPVEFLAVRDRLPGARLDGCKTRSGEVELARVYWRSIGAQNAIRHLTIVVDATATKESENIALGTQTIPKAKATVVGLTAAFAGDVSGLQVRLEYGDDSFPSALVIRSLKKGQTSLVAIWTEVADGAAGFDLSGAPIYGEPAPGFNPFAIDSVCPYGWLRSAKRYVLGRALIELDACEINNDLITGEKTRDILYRSLRLTDPGLPSAGRGIVFSTEADVASVLTFQAGDSNGCDDLEIVLPEAEYQLVMGPKAGECVTDPDILTKLKGQRPKDSVGPFKMRYGEGDWQVGWATSRAVTLPLTFDRP